MAKYNNAKRYVYLQSMVRWRSGPYHPNTAISGIARWSAGIAIAVGCLDNCSHMCKHTHKHMKLGTGASGSGANGEWPKLVLGATDFIFLFPLLPPKPPKLLSLLDV